MSKRREVLKSLHGRAFGIAPDGHLVVNKEGGVSCQLGLHADKIITSAQVLALFGTPIEVIAAPGAGLIVVPRVVQVYKPAGTAYGGVALGEDLVLKYTGAAGVQCSGVIETTGFLDQATAQMRVVHGPAATGSTPGDFTPAANAAVVMHLLVGEIITGDSPLVVRVWYDILASTLPVA